MPRLRGGRYLYQRRDEKTERGSIYEYDPSTHRETTALDLDHSDLVPQYWTTSSDGARIALLFSRNGSDAMVARVFDVRGRKWLSDEISGFRRSYPEWDMTNAFFYTWSPVDPAISEEVRAARSEIRYHVIGTDTEHDRRVRASTDENGVFEVPTPSPGGRWLISTRIRSSTERALYLQDRRRGDKAEWQLITPADSHAFYDATFTTSGIIVNTNEGAPRGRAFHVDLEHPARERWKEFAAAQSDATLDDVVAVKDYVFLRYLRDAEASYDIRRNDGTFVKKLLPPSLGSLISLNGSPRESEASVAFGTYTQPYQVYLLRAPSFELSPFPAGFEASGDSKYITEKVFYTSPDGTRAPIFMTRARTTAANKPAPLILNGYGTFGYNLGPLYHKGLDVWLDRGGIYAEAVTRGGGEYGEEWHQAGMKRGRKNVYDDFLAASEYLVRERWTSPDRFILRGVSSGGLLVAVAETERPDLYKAVVADVPLADMVRYTHGKDNGTLWVGEYGSPDVPAEFEVLLRYSPYHRVQRGTRYPPTLVISAESDDRVDPMHARKFVAKLQANYPCSQVLLRTEKGAGHGGATTTTAWEENEADIYAFALRAVSDVAP
jgi:prolyl oligopeptidase